MQKLQLILAAGCLLVAPFAIWIAMFGLAMISPWLLMAVFVFLACAFPIYQGFREGVK